jgi:hypothetical protein
MLLVREVLVLESCLSELSVEELPPIVNAIAIPFPHRRVCD